MSWAKTGKVLVAMLVIVAAMAGGYYLGTRATTQVKNSKPSPTVEERTEDQSNANTSVSPSAEVEKETGTIKGVIGYPGEGIPQLTVFALNTKNGGKNFFVKTGQNQGSFSIEDVEPGTYHVVAYSDDSKLSGAWSKMVPCGLSADCKDHTLIDVEVKSDETTGGVEVKDWYADPGTFPPKPQ